MSKKNDYTLLRKGYGLARGLDDEFVQACEHNNVPIEAIQRLVTPKGIQTWDEIARRITWDWQQDTSTSKPFVATVKYDCIFQPSSLTAVFWGLVCDGYKFADFKPIEECKNVSRETRVVEFEYVQIKTHYLRPSRVLDEMKVRVLRPALPEELACFVQKFPNEILKHSILALGAQFMVGGRCCVADAHVLDRTGPVFSSTPVDADASFDGYVCIFLAVRERAA